MKTLFDEVVRMPEELLPPPTWSTAFWAWAVWVSVKRQRGGVDHHLAGRAHLAAGEFQPVGGRRAVIEDRGRQPAVGLVDVGYQTLKRIGRS